MPESELLVLLAELAVALAGFSGIVIALQRRVEELDDLAFARLWRLIETSLASALFAILPLALVRVGLKPPGLWKICSGAFGLYLLITTVYFGRRFRATVKADPSLWRFNVPFAVITILVVATLLVAATGLEAVRGSGPYVAAVVLYLVLAGSVFRRLLLQPRSGRLR